MNFAIRDKNYILTDERWHPLIVLLQIIMYYSVSVVVFAITVTVYSKESNNGHFAPSQTRTTEWECDTGRNIAHFIF